jgi:hypothetical protein
MSSKEESKIQAVKDYIYAEDLKIWDSTWIYDSDRISVATDMGTPARGDGVGTPEVYLC